jgi:HEAT repeats
MATEAMLPPRPEAVVLRRLAGSLGLLLTLCLPVPALAVEIEVRGTLVAIRAEEEPLRAVLEAVGESCNLEIRSNVSTLEPVTIDTKLQPLPRLLKSLLREHSYVLQYGGAGARQLWILAPAGNSEALPPWSAGSRDTAFDDLVLALADPDPEVRVEAVLALGDIGDMTTAPFLTQSLTDESDDVRAAARAVLEDMDMAEAGSPGSVEPDAD